jgi:signal transduction histidine kinase
MSSRLRLGTNDDLRSALELATTFFGLEFGIVSRVDGDECFLEHVHCPESIGLEPGQRFPLEKAYCGITLAADQVVAIDAMSSSPHSDHPCFAAHGFESYIGIPLRIDGEVYGTLEFSSPTRRERNWSEADRLLMKLFARWVEGAIKQRHLAGRLDQALVSLDQAHLELARRNRDLNAFISTASHDLKEPLRNVGLLAGFLRADVIELGAEAEDSLRLIEETSARGQALVEDMLDFARVSRHRNRLETIDLQQLVDGVLNDLTTRIRQSRGSVVVGDLPELWTDRLQTQQLIQNLVVNALKYHRPGVPPEVRIELQTVGEGDERVIELSVTDNGIGFDQKHSERIFEPFKRLHDRGKYEGTGIGLTTCARIAERLNGSIRATSRPGEGSTFIVTLPASLLDAA